MSDRVSLTIADGVADVRLTRADKLNALDPAMFAAIGETIDRLAEEPEVRVVVLSGEGRGFCAGLDMASMARGGADLAAERRPDGANLPQWVAWGWRRLPMPVIAAVHGVALGGGSQIMAGADIRIAAPGTRIAIRETWWGLVPDMAGFVLWRGLLRDDVLRELVYTAREVTAEEALALGLVTRVADDPITAAHALAAEIAARGPAAIRAAKRLCNLASEADPPTMLKAETEEQMALFGSAEQRAVMAANMEPRPPVSGAT